MSHTPGPWKVHEGGRVNETSDYVVEREGEDEEYCTEICSVDTQWPTPEVGEANARLISAAPDLLDAAKDVLKQYAQSRIPIGPDLADSIRVFLGNAINKAEGRMLRDPGEEVGFEDSNGNIYFVCKHGESDASWTRMPSPAVRTVHVPGQEIPAPDDPGPSGSHTPHPRAREGLAGGYDKIPPSRCPFCGSHAHSFDDLVTGEEMVECWNDCPDNDCPLEGMQFTREDWEKRTMPHNS